MFIFDFIGFGLLVLVPMFLVVLYLKATAKDPASERRLQKLPPEVKAQLQSVRRVILNQDIDDILDRQDRAKIDEELRRESAELRSRQYRALSRSGSDRGPVRH